MRFKSNKPRVITLCIAVCMLFLCLPGVSTAGSDEKLKDFSSFSFPDNQEINTAAMRGNILVMVFGSIYCKPCVELLPVMNELQERYRDSDVRIFLLDIDMAIDPELQREFVKRHALKNPYINNALPIARDNKVYMLPTTLIVDREGTVVKRIYGFKKIKKFESVIKKLGPIIGGPKDPADNETLKGTAVNETAGDNDTLEGTAVSETAGDNESGYGDVKPAHQEHHP